MSCLKANLDEEDVSVRQLRRALMDTLVKHSDSSFIFLHDLPTYDLLVTGVSVQTRVPEQDLQGLPYGKLRLAFERSIRPIDPEVVTRRVTTQDFVSPTLFSVTAGGLLYFNYVLPALVAGCFALSGLYNIYSLREQARATMRRNRGIGQELLQGSSGPRIPQCEPGHCRHCEL